MTGEYHQSEMTSENTAVMVAVLRERTEVLGREMRELKEAQREQREEMRQSQKDLAVKLDAVLSVMSEARGGWRTLMVIGGVSSALGAALAWVIDHFLNRG